LLQPLPPPCQTVSAQPRDEDDVRSVVPPTASTNGDDAGNATSLYWIPLVSVERP
jgi:hypothetical protein